MSVTLDLVTCDPTNDEWVVYLIEDGPWSRNASN